jgi:hypothetical protein
MERFDVAVSQLRALPVLPPTFERRRIALPWSRRGFIAGHTSLPEVPHRGAAGRAQHRGVSTGIDSRDFKLEDVIKSVMNQVESTYEEKLSFNNTRPESSVIRTIGE